MLLALANFQIRPWHAGNALLIATLCATALVMVNILLRDGHSLSMMSVVLSATCFFGMRW